LGITQEISLWFLNKKPDHDMASGRNYDTICSSIHPTATLCRISSNAALRTAFTRGHSRGGNLVQNFTVKCEVVTDRDSKHSLPKKAYTQQVIGKQPGPRKGNQSGCGKDKRVGKKNMRAFRLLEQEARRACNLQSQLRLLNRAFKQIMTPISKKMTTNKPAPNKRTILYERRRKQFAAMLVTMRKRPYRACAWLDKMRSQHAGNARMLQILTILNIFVNNVLHTCNSLRVC